MSRTAIVILNYNGKALLERYLPSLIGHTPGSTLVIADNASTDDSVSFIQSHYPTIQLVELDKNYGYAGGYNRALSQVDADYLVLLNNDVEVTGGWLEPMIRLLDANPEIVSVQPKILSAVNRDHFDYAGAGGGMIDALGYPFCRGRIFNTLEFDSHQYDDTREVFWTSGACMLIRASAFRQLGGLDEGFFMHMEEIDWCWRARRQGCRHYYCGASTVFHVGGGTLSSLSPNKTYYNFRNGLSLVYRHWNGGELWWKLPLRVVLDWVAGIRFLLGGQFSHALGVLRAHIRFLGNIRAERRKRTEVQKSGKGYGSTGIYPGSVVWAHFIKRRKKLHV